MSFYHSILPLAKLAMLSSTLPVAALSAQTFFQAHPRGSFYRTFSDNATAPLIISLAQFAGASSLHLKPSGKLQVAGPGSPRHDAIFCAVFSTSSTLLADTQQERITGALASAASISSPCETRGTFIGNLPTQISQDFFIPFAGFMADIPLNAQYLFIAVPDDRFADNVSPAPLEYGVHVTATVVPEPSSLALLAGAGLVLVCVHRRRLMSR